MGEARREEALLRLLIEEVPAAIAMFDRDMRYIAVSRRWTEAYLPGVSQPIGKSHYDVFPDCPERWRADHRRGLAGETVRVEEDSWGLPDGSTVWMRYEVKPWKDDDGQVGGILIVTEDITERKRGEELLQATNARLEAALRAPQIAVFTQDRDLRYTWINNPAARFSSQSVVGSTDVELLEREDEGRRLEAIKRRSMDTRRPVREEVMFHIGGQPHWFDLIVEPKLDRSGAVSGVACVAVDISERRAAQLALESSEERLSIAKSAAGLGIYDHDLIADRINWDDRVRALWGVAADAPVTNATFLAGVHPDDRAVVDAAVAVALDPHRHGLLCAEYRVIKGADGSTRWIAASGRTTFEDGRPVRLVGTVQDITDRKESELERERNRALLDAVLMSMPAGVMIADPSGRIARWNKANEDLWGLRGIDPQALESLHEWEHWKGWRYPAGERLAAADWPLVRALSKRETVPGELIEIQPFNGQERRVILKMAAPAIGSDGSMIGAVAVQTDITERVRFEEALKRAHRQKDVFLATLSHELRNPLAPIRTAAELLARPALEPSQLSWIAGVIQRQTRQLAWLLDDLLDLSRITQGKLSLRREPVSLRSIIDSAVETSRPLIDRKNHRLSVALPSAVPVLDADPVRTAQILSNLLDNAAKYTDPGGSIELRATVDAAWVEIEVRDSGIGIPAEKIPSLFEMFSQSSSSAGRSEGGLGIGLALVKALAELHGGEVRASSDGVGKGSTFTVRLPLASAAAGEQGPRDLQASKLRACRVLVVDDNRDAADSLAMTLRLSGHDVRAAYDGPSALALAPVFRPDFAILDIGMPGMNGYELAQRLRAESWGSAIELIALSGWGQQDDKNRALEAGFDVHLTKPVEPKQLEDVLKNRRGRTEHVIRMTTEE